MIGRERELARLRAALDGVQAGAAAVAVAGESEELYLSVKTVETHLRTVFSELGVGSRAEVAAAFARNAV